MDYKNDLEMEINCCQPSGGGESDALNRGCRLFWRAIIAQSIIDASSKHKRKETQLAKSGAKHWLSGNSENFDTVCTLAGYSPSAVRKRAGALTQKDGAEYLAKKNENSNN